MSFREGSEKVEEPQQALKLENPSDDDETKVKLDEEPEDRDDEREEDPEKVAAPDKPEQGRKKDGKWAEKKAARARNHREEKAWERERAEYDRRFAREREDNDRRFNEMRQEVERLRAQSTQGRQGGDPFASKMTDINAQIAQELKDRKSVV